MIIIDDCYQKIFISGDKKMDCLFSKRMMNQKLRSLTARLRAMILTICDPKEQ